MLQRFLKKNGILRIVVPDLEQICHQYLKAIQRVDDGEKLSKFDATWMRLEIFDQKMTRDSSGGGMEKFLKSNPPNSEFVIKRCQEQVKSFFSKNEKQSVQIQSKRIPLHLKGKKIVYRILNFNN